MATLQEVLSLGLPQDDERIALDLWKQDTANEIKSQFQGDEEGYEIALGLLDSDINDAVTSKYDTGQGLVSSAVSSAGRGFGKAFTSTVEGAGQGIGALNRNFNPLQVTADAIREITGDNAVTRGADAALSFIPRSIEGLGRSGTEALESELPVNPIYAENPIVKGSGVLGQAGGQLASALIPSGIATKVGAGAAKVIQGTALTQSALMGLNSGYQEADRLGITDPKKRDAMAAMYAAAESGTEALGGLGSLAFGKRLVEGTAERGLSQFLKTTAGEGGEEVVAGRLQDVASNLFAEEDPNNPGYAKNGQKIPSISPVERDFWTNSVEDFAYGSLGGAVFGGVEALAARRNKPQGQRINEAMAAAPIGMPAKAAELESVAAMNDQANSPAVAELLRKNADAQAQIPQPTLEEEVRIAANEIQPPTETPENEEVVQSEENGRDTQMAQSLSAGGEGERGLGQVASEDGRRGGRGVGEGRMEAGASSEDAEDLSDEDVASAWLLSQPEVVQRQLDNDMASIAGDDPEVDALFNEGRDDEAFALMDQKREEIIRNRMSQAQTQTETINESESDTDIVSQESPKGGVDESASGQVIPDERGVVEQSQDATPAFESTLRSEIQTLQPAAQARWSDDVVAEAVRWQANPDSDTTLTQIQQNLVQRIAPPSATVASTPETDPGKLLAQKFRDNQRRRDSEPSYSTDPKRQKAAQDAIDEMEAQNRLDDNEPDQLRFSRVNQNSPKVVKPEDVQAALDRFASSDVGKRMLQNLLFANNAREALNLPDLKNRKFSKRSLRAISEANGFHDPVTSKSVVLLDEITPIRGETPADAVFRVALHEQFHGGLQYMLATDAKFRNEVYRLANQLNKQGWGEIAERYPELLDDPMSMFQEWMIARLESGDPVELSKTDPLWKRFWDALKDLVRRVMGSNIPENELDRMARSLAAKMLNQPDAFTGLEGFEDEVSTSDPALSKPLQESDYQRFQTPEQREAAAQALADELNVNRNDIMLMQRMGLAEAGNPAVVNRVKPMVVMARTMIGQSGKPTAEMKVSDESTRKAWEMTQMYGNPTFQNELIADMSRTISDSQGKPHDAAGAVEAMNAVLLRYGKALAETGDQSLYLHVRNNFDQTGIRGAAQALNARSYISQQDPMIRLDQLVEQAKDEEVSTKVTSKENQEKLKTKAKGDEKSLDEAIEGDSQVEEADAELEQEEETNPATEQALRIIDQLDKEQTEWVGPEKNRNRIQELKKEAITSELTDKTRPGFLNQERFIERYAKGFEALGVKPEVAINLAQRLYNENLKLRTNRENRARDRKAGKISVKAIAKDILETAGYALHDPAQTAEKVQQYLTRAGFTEAEASRFASKYAPLIREKILQAREIAFTKAAEQLDAKGIERGTIDSIRRAIRAGVLDPADAVAQGLAEQAGFKNITPEQYAKMAALDAKMDKGGVLERAILQKQMTELIAQNMPDLTWKKRIARSYTNSVLSGIGTMAIQFTTPVFSGLTRIGTEIGTIMTDAATGKIRRADVPGQIAQTLQNAVDSVKGFTGDFGYALKSGVTSSSTEHTHLDEGNLKEDLRRAQQMIRSSDPNTKLKGLSRILFASTDYTHRIMLAADEAMTNTMKRFFAKQGVLRLAGLKDVPGLSTEEAKVLIAKAVSHAQQKAQEAARNGSSPLEAGAIGRDSMNEFLENAVADIFGEEAGAKLRQQYTSEAQMEIGTRAQEVGVGLDFPNLISQVMVNASNFARQIDPLWGRILTGFVTVPVNMANRSLAFTPIGLARAMAKTREKRSGTEARLYEQTMGSDLQLRQRYVESIAGTVGMLVAAALAGMDDDEEYDKHTGFRFTGYGPKDKNLRDAWLKAGNRPYAIEWMDKGKVKAALSYARGGPEILKLPSAAVGALDDMRLNGQLENKDVIENVGNWTTGALGAGLKATNFFGLKNLTNLVGISDQSERNAAGSLAWMGSGFIPWSGFTKSITKLGQGPLDNSSVKASIIANIPIVSLAGEPALNFLGDTKGFQPFDLFTKASDKANYTGFPVYISASNKGPNSALYEFMLETGATPSMPLRSTLEEKNGFLSDRKWGQYVKTRGKIIKDEMYARLPELKRLSTDERDKAISSISSKATSAAKKKMGLE